MPGAKADGDNELMRTWRQKGDRRAEPMSWPGAMTVWRLIVMAESIHGILRQLFAPAARARGPGRSFSNTDGPEDPA
jgi:hypothetical protein